MAEPNDPPRILFHEKNNFASDIPRQPGSIPVFIGFTEFALQADGKPLAKMKGSKLVNVPLFVESIAQYEKAFGRADDTGDLVIESHSDSNYVLTHERDNAPYTPGYMYPSLVNFFLNGREGCYIISLGSYADFGHTVDATLITDELPNLKLAIDAAEQTGLILPTDLIRFGPKNYYDWGTSLTDYCGTKKTCFCMLDVIPSNPVDSTYKAADIDAYRSMVQPSSPSYAAAYYPYLNSFTPYALKADFSGVRLNGSRDISSTDREKIIKFLSTCLIPMPPSPIMAGIYARIERDSGVWTPPANVAPRGIQSPVVDLTNPQQEYMSMDPVGGKCINAIRNFRTRGTLVWGARTNDGNSPDWRYINVRRLCISMEKDIRAVLETFIFKPNNQDTWTEVKTIVNDYLFGLYVSGAFIGTTAESSYIVLIGQDVTMTEEDIQNGYLRVNILVSPLIPAEFIELSFLQLVGQ